MPANDTSPGPVLEVRQLGRSRKPRPGILASLPRRQLITSEPTHVSPPMMRTTSYSASHLRVFSRLFVWLIAGTVYLLGNMVDLIRRRGSETQRAIRLRRTLEKSGGTFKKIGRLLAMRIDVLPWSYCVELSKIDDQMAPFAVEKAIQRVESATGEPLGVTFDRFDPEPIVSSTTACVYQAILKDGRKVAVKVRRPGFGERFMADARALDWILDICEFLSIIRPGFTRNLRRDLRESIQDELNFTFEARNQALFRTEAKKSGKKFFDAPRVFFEYSGSDVVFQEFASGMWLWELIAAVEEKDPAALARAKELNIDPDLVAKRLLWVHFWGVDQHLIFLTDLHPENVIVRENSKLSFIDFSSVGSLSHEKRQALQQTMHYAWKRDPLEMARASMVLLEPLPPIDTTKYIKGLEAHYWKFMYALESKHIQWWERTSARMWLGFVRIAKENKITMDIHVLRMIRASLLSDTIAARLSPRIDHVKEYHRFFRYRSKAARKRMEKRIRKQFQRGVDDRLYLQIEGITDTSERLFRQLQRFLSTPTMKFNAVLDKPVYAFSIFFKFLGQIAGITTLAVLSMVSIEWLVSRKLLSVMEILSGVYSNRIFQVVLLGLLFINIRSVLFRLGDKEI